MIFLILSLAMAAALRQKLPVLYIPHGGGPCFFMNPPPGPPGTWTAMETFLRGLPQTVGRLPQSILIISAHWEESICTVQTAERPSLLYDYYGFPEETYHLSYPAPGSPALAAKVRKLLSTAGIEHKANSSRGFDHGTFIPLILSYPEANIPVVQLSLRQDLDPGFHIALGEALQSLREEEVLIIGSGMSYHNLNDLFSGRQNGPAAQFDSWLTETVCQLSANKRNERLKRWVSAPGARASHPREEHLIPLMVVAGAAGSDIGERCYNERLLGKANSAYKFG